MTLHFLSDVANDTKIVNYAIIVSLESETMGKLINILKKSSNAYNKQFTTKA